MFCCKARSGCRGCGELYWNEWFNDPPSGCEPCNCHGQYVGRGATAPNEMPLQSFGDVPGAAPISVVPPLELAPVPTPVD